MSAGPYAARGWAIAVVALGWAGVAFGTVEGAIDLWLQGYAPGTGLYLTKVLVDAGARGVVALVVGGALTVVLAAAGGSRSSLMDLLRRVPGGLDVRYALDGPPRLIRTPPAGACA